MTSLTVHKTDRKIVGTIDLARSKSISNRALIIRALSKQDFPIHHLANAKDTRLLNALLPSNSEVRDAGAAGTTFRFLTAYLSLQNGTQVLTGTERMKQRPIGILVDALRHLGANISYIEKEGYPPLSIGAPDNFGQTSTLTIAANTSSQYISALLMIAPTLPNGLSLTLAGKVVSRPYIEMTLRLMQYFGVQHDWRGDTIHVAPQSYQPKEFTVEADWSAASYYYAMAAFADEVDLQVNGLHLNSVQGDAVLVEMMKGFGVVTEFNEAGIRLRKDKNLSLPKFEWDFIRCPDLAQTLFVVCGGLGVEGWFTGLETLRIKETDRIGAMQTELNKVAVSLTAAEHKDDYYVVRQHAKVTNSPIFSTYEDHRMAMALAPLAMFGEVGIAEPNVVEKSYPAFWEDLERLGFAVEGL